MPALTPWGRALRVVRRAWPVALHLYQRWDRLSDEEKERYRRNARQAAERVRRRGGGGRRRR